MIHDDVFLTAAHCRDAFEDGGGAFVGVYDVEGKQVENNDNQKDFDDDNWYEIETTLPHPKHKVGSPYNDVMLVKLKPLRRRRIVTKKEKSKIDNTDDSKNYDFITVPQLPYYNINRDPNFHQDPSIQIIFNTKVVWSGLD